MAQESRALASMVAWPALAVVRAALADSLAPALCSCPLCRSTSLKDPRCRVPWSQFCSDPWRTAEELHDHGCIARSKSYLYFHMTDQYHCLHTHDGQWAVDFVGRVDEPNEDWAEVRRAGARGGCVFGRRWRPAC
jgi:hypothetical protein